MLIVCIIGCLVSGCTPLEEGPPNILWITCEDINPHLGCYGDPYAYTPNLDKMAASGIRYEHAYVPAPVCTPTRSSIITGVHASSMGTQHLRGQVPLSDSIRCFTGYLREAGYYCSNNSKEDYNFITPDAAWDASSDSAHWRGRKEGQPFFSVFNITLTHQSQTRYLQSMLDIINDTLSREARHDPDQAILPPYYPDTKIVRQNVAALYTQITLMDKEVKRILDQLEKDRLKENTIVFFYSDHGEGLPRHKRWIHTSGTRVPLIISFPEKYQYLAPGPQGSVRDELVSLVDLAPTMLSLTGLEIPEYMQGQAFLGEEVKEKRSYVYGIRDRVDEVLEFSRSIRNERFQYIRNFYPHRPRMQRSFYSEETPIRKEVRRLHRKGQLTGSQQWLMMPEKPAEELYDTKQDPYEMNNLAGDPEYGSVLKELRNELHQWMIHTRDLSLLPEPEMRRRSGSMSPYDMAREPGQFQVEKILQVANLVGKGPKKINSLMTALDDPEPAIRYWGAVGLVALGEQAKPAEKLLLRTLNDETPCVRFAAAEALIKLGNIREPVNVLTGGLFHENSYVTLMAVQTLVALGDQAKPAASELEAMLSDIEIKNSIEWYIQEAASWLLSTF